MEKHFRSRKVETVSMPKTGYLAPKSTRQNARETRIDTRTLHGLKVDDRLIFGRGIQRSGAGRRTDRGARHCPRPTGHFPNQEVTRLYAKVTGT